ncbi:MAG: YIP1 family protein [Caldilineaceae bacterium]|nr:YIP1 family protein [Caldilineaceae bacterium]
MNSSRFLAADGTLPPQRSAWWSGWLPTLHQVQQAIQLQFDTESVPEREPSGNVWTLSMRQGLGLVVLAALLAGLLPFLVNAVTAMRFGSTLPLAQLAQQQATDGTIPALWSETWQRLAGLPPALLPGWLAGLLTSLGVWINWPLRWITWWLVYGTAVLLAAKIWGAPPTLQRFLAVTSYAAVPLILTGLGPVPWLGALAQLVAVVWMLLVYLRSVRAVTGLDWGRAVLAVILPGAVVSVIAFTLLLATATTILRAIF